MPTRRQESEHRVFRQDAFASSEGEDPGLLGNLVAACCSKISDPEEISVRWWLQQISWRPGGLKRFTEQLVDTFRSKITYRVCKGGFDDTAFVSCNPDEGVAKVIADKLRNSLVNPVGASLRDVSLLNFTGVGFPGLWEALLEIREQEIKAVGEAIVETAITLQVFEELDFALHSRSFILIEGREGIGKTESAKAWCSRHPGRAVYVRLESGTDEVTFYRSIARAIGTACSYGRKATEMRARIQDALQPGQLMLVVDEAHFLWPQSERSVRSAPKRVDWLRTALVDYGVPIAMISTPQYFANACSKFLKGGWNANQVQRRLTHTASLPEGICIQEMKAVAKRYFPRASGSDLSRLAFTAVNELGFLTVLLHLRKRVDFAISKRPGRPESECIEEALAAYEKTSAPAISVHPSKSPATSLRTIGSAAAGRVPGRETAPGCFSSVQREQSVPIMA